MKTSTMTVSLMSVLAAPAAAFSVMPAGGAAVVTSSAAASSQRVAASPVAIAELIKPIVGGGSSSTEPDIGDALPDCPSTLWNAKDIDVDEWQAKYKARGHANVPD